MVGNHEILISLTSSYNLQEACRELVEHALEHGASDNVSAVAWAVPEGVDRHIAGTAKRSKTATGTVMLPPERAVNDAATIQPAGEKRLNRILIIAIFAIMIAAGFTLGWLVAGWVKGGGEKPVEKTVVKHAASTEVGESEPDPVANFRENTEIILLDSAGSMGGQAEAAKDLLESKGYKNLSTGKAQKGSKTLIYYGSETEEMLKILKDDLGMPSEIDDELDAGVLEKFNADIVIVLAPGWDGY